MKQTGKRILSVLTAVMLLVGSIGIAAFAEDDDGHVHEYTDVTVVEPGYMYGGYTIYRCSCGDTIYGEYTSPLPHPTCEATGGRVGPGESFTVQVRLRNCSKLTDLILDVLYDETCLTMTEAVCAEYGEPTFLTIKALEFETIDPAVQEALLLLTFDVAADAPCGVQPVAISGCGVSGCAVDNGRQLPLTEQRAELNVYKPSGLSVTVPSEPVCRGDTVQMTVDLTDNSGLAGMAFDVHYDPQALTLTGVQEAGMLETGSVIVSGSLSVMPLHILWDDATATENHYEVGTILTLTFAVNETAPTGATSVWLTFDADEMLDMQLEPVEMTTTGASLTIVDRVAGDADDNGTVNLMDVVYLGRFIAGGWNVEINTRNADVNGDGLCNLKDVVLLRRYLVDGWDVVLV